MIAGAVHSARASLFTLLLVCAEISFFFQHPRFDWIGSTLLVTMANWCQHSSTFFLLREVAMHRSIQRHGPCMSVHYWLQLRHQNVLYISYVTCTLLAPRHLVFGSLFGLPPLAQLRTFGSSGTMKVHPSSSLRAWWRTFLPVQHPLFQLTFYFTVYFVIYPL